MIKGKKKTKRIPWRNNQKAKFITVISRGHKLNILIKITLDIE